MKLGEIESVKTGGEEVGGEVCSVICDKSAGQFNAAYVENPETDR